jgi:amidohydrolase
MKYNQIDTLTQKYLHEAIDFRRHLHQYPELSFQEHKTARWIGQQLTLLKIEHRMGVGGNSIIAKLESNPEQGLAIALRADFDALPIQEETHLPFESHHAGVMHACGHDFHTASLLTTAKVLNDSKSLWNGTIYLIFQHAEEVLPGGAIAVLNDHPFDGPQPIAIVGQHVAPELPVGSIGLKSGRYMASSDEIYIKIHGKGGHGALPQHINDTVLASAQMIVNLQQVSARLAPPTIPTVLSFGRFIANGATNVIPDLVQIEGTFRTFDENWRSKAHEHIIHIAGSTAESYGCTCQTEIRKGYPVLRNDEDLYQKARAVALDFVGGKQLVELDYRMTSEDFSYYSQAYPSLFYRIGVGHADESKNHPLHSSKFSLNEAGFENAIGMMVRLAIKLLS